MDLAALAQTHVCRLTFGRGSLFERLQHLPDVRVLVRQVLLRPLIGFLRFVEKLAHLKLHRRGATHLHGLNQDVDGGFDNLVADRIFLVNGVHSYRDLFLDAHVRMSFACVGNQSAAFLHRLNEQIQSCANNGVSGALFAVSSDSGRYRPGFYQRLELRFIQSKLAGGFLHYDYINDGPMGLAANCQARIAEKINYPWYALGETNNFFEDVGRKGRIDAVETGGMKPRTSGRLRGRSEQLLATRWRSARISGLRRMPRSSGWPHKTI